MAGGEGRWGVVSAGERLRQDKSNGTTPFGRGAITPCLHIVFTGVEDGAIVRPMTPCHSQRSENKPFPLEPSRIAAVQRHVG